MSLVHPTVVARVLALRADPAQADRLLDRWLQRFSAVADRAFRRTVMAECLAEADDGTLLGLLPRLEARAEAGEAGYRWMSTELALTPSVLQELPYARQAELYAAAMATGQERTAARFLHARPLDKIPPIANPHLDVSPGQRIALARGRDRMALDRLAHDRDPRVIAALLDNPRLLELDVVHIAALRPTRPEVLEVVAAHRRWATSYRVRKALAFNPATPTALARQLLPTLLRQDLREIAASLVLHADLRAEVQSLLQGRAQA